MEEFHSAIAKRVAPAAPRVVPEGDARRAGKILLAECNRLNEKIAVRILQAAGHQVTTVTTGEQVVAALQQSTFDLILMDAEMPKISGFEATGIIRTNEAATGEHIPIVAMTSSATQGDRCLRAGMDEYIAKPLNLDQLRRVVTSCLSPADAEPDFDLTAALSRVGGDQAFLLTLASMFVQDSQAVIADIRTAVEQQDGGGLSRAAHKLKGSALPFCSTAVTNAAQKLESIGESGQLAAAMDEYRRFEAEVGRLLTALNALLLRADGGKISNTKTVAEPE